MKNISISLLLLALLFTGGCKTAPKEFKLVFTMESMNIYKLSVEINNDKSYHIQQQNQFFDTFAKKGQINHSDGKLSDEEYNELIRLIGGNWLFNMKDTYGFSSSSDSVKSPSPLGNLFYHLDYTENNKSKYILIRPNLSSDDNPKDLLRLIKFLNDFSSAHLKK